MENIFIILVIVLFILAISDLIVGVSNDAVNFLNSAIGAKAAPRIWILVIASLGVVVGASFSGGMMEIARKGIFHPQMFNFNEIMIIFLAVMLTDVILLDLFNTLGLPTSTTVSIVFELLGASVIVALIKIGSSPETISDLNNYINSDKALAIITGILMSIVISFVIGAFVQYITRIAFTFNIRRNSRYFGAIWGGLAIATITHFILIKGAKGSILISPELAKSFQEQTAAIFLMGFAGWTVLFQILKWLTRIDILKITVLVGTFALAMAFAGNDLVNFIGVPLAGFESYKIFSASSGADPQNFLMSALSESVKPLPFILLLAGAIMVITLWLSRKARSVVTTTVNLSRQDEGEERFGTTMFSRAIVRYSILINQGLTKIFPVSFIKAIDRRFIPSKEMLNTKEKPAFDMLRASVNLTVASILISLATSLKLPLSTTYVTFMVAMGTSLSDRAWGRESAVYRITGVFTVIGGWFMTAFIAFTVAGIFALVMFFGSYYAIALLVLLAGFFVYRTHVIHKKNEIKKEKEEQFAELTVLKPELIIEKESKQINELFDDIGNAFELTLRGLEKESFKKLKNAKSVIKDRHNKLKKLKNKINTTVSMFPEDKDEAVPCYIQVLEYQNEITVASRFIVVPCFEYVDNNHKPLLKEQIKDISQLFDQLKEYFDFIRFVINKRKYDELQHISDKQDDLMEALNNSRKKHIKRVKNKEIGTKNSLLYLDILSELKNILLSSSGMLKAQKEFHNKMLQSGKA